MSLSIKQSYNFKKLCLAASPPMVEQGTIVCHSESDMEALCSLLQVPMSLEPVGSVSFTYGSEYASETIRKYDRHGGTLIYSTTTVDGHKYFAWVCPERTCVGAFDLSDGTEILSSLRKRAKVKQKLNYDL